MSFFRQRLEGAGVLSGVLAVALGCTGQVPGTADRIGTEPGHGMGSGGAQVGAGAGAGGAGGDPYAVPTSPPASVLVATPRVARLSREQWSNAVRDLLKLTDISDVD
ncbi:MAG TPA: hypothetical protein VIK01_19000, partial [Polyangiaceae bacterium]